MSEAAGAWSIAAEGPGTASLDRNGKRTLWLTQGSPRRGAPGVLSRQPERRNHHRVGAAA
jgi:hypothetical protein